MPELEIVARERKVVRTKSGKLLKDIERKKKRERFRGVPPRPTFDIDALPPSTRLNENSGHPQTVEVDLGDLAHAP